MVVVVQVLDQPKHESINPLAQQLLHAVFDPTVGSPVIGNNTAPVRQIRTASASKPFPQQLRTPASEVVSFRRRIAPSLSRLKKSVKFERG